MVTWSVANGAIGAGDVSESLVRDGLGRDVLADGAWFGGRRSVLQGLGRAFGRQPIPVAKAR
jgi:hypothetical protein